MCTGESAFPQNSFALMFFTLSTFLTLTNKLTSMLVFGLIAIMDTPVTSSLPMVSSLENVHHVVRG